MASPPTSKQSNDIVFKVYNYLKELLVNYLDATSREIFTQIQVAIGTACGIHLCSVQKICEEAHKSMDADRMETV